MSRMSNRFDGVAFAMHRGRFTGTIDLEDEEAEAAAIGETVVMVVVATVNDAAAKLDKEGDLARVAVFKATDARILDDELKNLMVERLGLSYGDAPVLIVPGERTEAQRAQVQASVEEDDEDELEVDEETGEIVIGFEPEVEQLSFDSLAPAPRPEGPRTVPFNTMPSFLPDSSEIVGAVGRGDEAWRNI